MPNPKITFRIWTDAQAKLFEEMSHYRGDRPPIGQFISRLILACPPELREEVRAQMDAAGTVEPLDEVAAELRDEIIRELRERDAAAK